MKTFIKAKSKKLDRHANIEKYREMLQNIISEHFLKFIASLKSVKTEYLILTYLRF